MTIVVATIARSDTLITKPSLLDRIKIWFQVLWLRIFGLPRAEKIIEQPRLERHLAVLQAVPRRCGLCRSFVGQDMTDTVAHNPAFAKALNLLSPTMMGAIKGKTASKPVGSDAARELRPDLRDQWRDYGGCAKWSGLGVWAFAEAPMIPRSHVRDAAEDAEEMPCKEWR